MFLSQPDVLEARQRITLRMRAAQPGMKLIRLLATAMAAAATLCPAAPAGPDGCAFDRARAALRLAARGGARYAASAPRLFAAAGEQRQLLREDLALQTAEDVAGTLGAMKGVHDEDRPDGQLRRRRPVSRRSARPWPACRTAFRR